jgi:hypothetical protein
MQKAQSQKKTEFPRKLKKQKKSARNEKIVNNQPPLKKVLTLMREGIVQPHLIMIILVVAVLFLTGAKV